MSRTGSSGEVKGISLTAALQHRVDLVPRHGLAEEIALYLIALQPFEGGKLFLRFHTFRNNAQAERMREDYCCGGDALGDIAINSHIK